MTQSTFSRREALKLLLATGGGLTAAAFIPTKWLKPIVQSGVLPVHAMASGCPLVTRTAIVGTVTFTASGDSHDIPFVEGDITQAMLACGYSTVTFQWTSGENTPAADVYVSFRLEPGASSYGEFMGAGKASSISIPLSNFNLNGPQYSAIVLDPAWAEGTSFPYSWNVGTMTVNIS